MTKSRFSARKMLRALLIIAISIVALGLVFTYLVRPAMTGPITEVTFHQSKSVPDYDGSTYTVTDSGELDALAELIEKHNAVPELVTASGIPLSLNPCAGGTGTDATITFASGRSAELYMYRCGEGDGVYAGFIDESTSLFSSWKDS